MPTSSPLVFSTASYRYLAADLCRVSGWEEGEVERRCFPDGENYQRIRTRMAGRDVVLVGGTVSDEDTLELYDLACGLVTHGAYRLTLMIPYYGYATMDRESKWGEVVTAKTRARLLSAIPHASRGNRAILFDLHSEGLPHYFEAELRAYHHYGKRFVQEEARRIGGRDFVLACTDAGRAKWVESLANDLSVSASFVFKRRLDGRTTEVSAVSAQVQDRLVIIYDDMIRTGGSLLQAARAYREAGARSLAAITTHGVFPEQALARIEASGLFSEVVCTDSHPQARALAGDFLRVRPVAPMLLSAWHSLAE